MHNFSLKKNISDIAFKLPETQDDEISVYDNKTEVFSLYVILFNLLNVYIPNISLKDRKNIALQFAAIIESLRADIIHRS